MSPSCRFDIVTDDLAENELTEARMQTETARPSIKTIAVLFL